MFKQINKVHVSTNEEGKALINLDNVVSVSQQPNHYSNKLFNENGDLVSQELDKPYFEILTNEGVSFVVKQDQYEELKKVLTNFTEIDKINSRGEEGKALIKLDNVRTIVEQPKVQEGEDSEGNPTYKPTQYAILGKEGKTFYVLEPQFNTLIDLLTK